MNLLGYTWEWLVLWDYVAEVGGLPVFDLEIPPPAVSIHWNVCADRHRKWLLGLRS